MSNRQGQNAGFTNDVHSWNRSFPFTSCAFAASTADPSTDSSQAICRQSTLGHSLPVSFISKKFACDPLAVKYVTEHTSQYFMENLESAVELTAGKCAISAYTDAAVADQVDCLINSSIIEHEAKISSSVEAMDYCCLPILACHSVQEQFSKSLVPFEVKIFEAAGGYVPLEKLSQVCKDKAHELAQYLLPTASEDCYQWYWESEVGFSPYGASVSEVLEQAFPSEGATLVSLGRWSYEVDTCSMTQTNTTTRNVRLVERRRKHISVQVKVHSDHLHEALSMIKMCVLSKMKETTVSIPPFGQDTSCIGHLLQIAQRSFIFAQKTDYNDGDIFLQGKQDLVTEVELELTKEILLMKLSSDALRIPGHWEAQDYACELKVVSQGTAECAYIKQRMTESGFCANILRIERIQNRWLWEVCEQSRKRVSDKNSGQVNEKWLFHGTRGIPPIKIYNSEQGFDNRLSSGGMWGEGAYFAAKAKYSDSFAYTTPEGNKQILFVRVVTGISYRSPPDSSLKAPPKKADHSSASMFEDERYDSVSGVTSGSEVYVIYEHGKVYPAYLITYLR